MTIKEISEVIENLRKEGNSDEDIAASFYMMFSDKKIDLNQFVALLDVLGYELDEEFFYSLDGDERKKAIDYKKNIENT